MPRKRQGTDALSGSKPKKTKSHNFNLSTLIYTRMDIPTIQYRIRQCSKCPGETKFICTSCPCILCSQCKEKHAYHLETIDHNVVLYCNECNQMQKQDTCRIQIDVSYFDFSICNHRRDQVSNIFQNIQAGFKTTQQHEKTFCTIRGEALLYRKELLKGIIADINGCQRTFTQYQSELSLMAEKLKKEKSIDNVIEGFDYQHSCVKQKRKMHNHLTQEQIFEQMYEQSAKRPIRFILSKKYLIKALSSRNLTHHCQLSIIKSLNTNEVTKVLSKIKITNERQRRVRHERLFKSIPDPEIRHHFTVPGIAGCHHISVVTQQVVNVNDKNKLVLTNIKGGSLPCQSDLYPGSLKGTHTANNECEIFYIDKHLNINKYSNDVGNITTFVKNKDSPWRPECLYWSSSTEDLLVGMCRYDENRMRGKITRYNKNGKPIQTIQYRNSSEELIYKNPCYITENNNGDILVSESRALIATDREGKYRFSYKRHQNVPTIFAHAICTDILSNILFCERRSNSVQMLDKDGNFIQNLRLQFPGGFCPHSLGYDIITHRLWVGSADSNILCVYRYMTRQEDQLESEESTTYMLGLKSDILITEKRKQHEVDENILQLISPPILYKQFELTNATRCGHISRVNTDLVWISDYNSNLIQTDISGNNLDHREDVCMGCGVHTINNESELIYIDKKYNIIKLSKDNSIKSIFNEATDSKWKPRCLYWSKTTRDLLIGMCTEDRKTGKLTRYDQTGLLRQSVQQDANRLDIYHQPNCIKENTNGDIVVADMTVGVVVTDCKGRHRFSYTGPPSGSGLYLYGICTDALSHILLCDGRTNSVQMIDSNGQFLSLIPTFSKDLQKPISLSYDVTNHRLWVGYYRKVRVYSFIRKHSDIIDGDSPNPEEDALVSSS